ncbi:MULTISPECIES: energy transducer TonB [Aestuariibaculum]|uniref:Energy transducer TonB n=1 Tax=Aestuariibaculum lutulentum TaxID=2920935 RepID=A0ABS9RPH6_9FLAO|nr:MULTISPECIES: energy transducer TonB [Aestuariibaculum]MCH4554014.1 energy transducer TonB [Aestuariibaculum lutulentum]MCR8669511.1 energy transducer TonB [Aestuariibaculum sp. M13]
MEPKKNPKANVGRNSSLYFAIGLALLLFLTNMAINYKTYDDKEVEIGMVAMEQEIEEEIPLTNQMATPPPPPPPPAAPEVIEVVEDEVEVEETVIESTEVSQETEIVEVADVEVAAAVEEDIEVPFAVIENVPVFPGCEKKKTNQEKKDCMSEKITQFVGKKFNTDLASDLGLSGRQRINVIFKIDKSGKVTGIRARAPHPGLEKEAARVIGMLPQMEPGKQRGKAVTVPYSLPIVFQVQD